MELTGKMAIVFMLLAFCIGMSIASCNKDKKEKAIVNQERINEK